MPASTELRKSAAEFFRRITHRGYIVLIGVASGLLGAFNEFFDGAIKLAPWMSWAIVAASLFIAAFWAFHDLRVERDIQRDSGGDSQARFDALSDLLGRSVEVGRELSQAWNYPLLRAWEAHTRKLVASAYGEGEAVHIFTRELRGMRVVQGESIALARFSLPPPYAETINSVKELLGRMGSMTIRPNFEPTLWAPFNPVAFTAQNGRKVREIESGWICPWCSHEEIDSSSSRCDSCNAEVSENVAYRSTLEENV